jgi:hypothetical protein
MPKATPLTIAVLAASIFCFPAAASAGTLVPPGNSAANQYTETFPTSQGEEESELEKKNGVKPNDVLGAGNTRKLDQEGATGKAVAQFTAETAPVVQSSGGGESSGNQGKGHGQASKGEGGSGGSEGEEASQGSGGSGGSGGNSGSGGATAASGSGSSGLGEIVSQATGGSSGGIGLLLPLILIGAVVWSALYVWRNRQQRVV